MRSRNWTTFGSPQLSVPKPSSESTSPTYVQLFSTPQRRGEPTRSWRANFGASKGDFYGEYWKLGGKKRCAMRRSGGAQGWTTSFWRWKEDGGRGLAMSFAWRKAGIRSRRCLGRPLERGTGADHSALGGGPSRTRWKQLERRGTSCGSWPRTGLNGRSLLVPYAPPAGLRGLSEWVSYTALVWKLVSWLFKTCSFQLWNSFSCS